MPEDAKNIQQIVDDLIESGVRSDVAPKVAAEMARDFGSARDALLFMEWVDERRRLSPDDPHGYRKLYDRIVAQGGPQLKTIIDGYIDDFRPSDVV